MIMMSKHLQLYHAACADRPIITPQQFQKYGVIIGLLVLFSTEQPLIYRFFALLYVELVSYYVLCNSVN